MSHTQTSPYVLNSEDIYNLVMGRIEPDLTTPMLPLLDDLYMNETKEQRAERAEWYNKVFARFEIDYQTFMNKMKDYYMGMQRRVTSSVRAFKENAEKESTRAIEDSLEHS